jgi:uncharacterized protein (DUF427 family)
MTDPRQTTAHRITIEPTRGRVRITFAGEVIADTWRALTLREGSLGPVQYLPLADVRREVLEASDHASHCPFKGDAGYYDLVVSGRRSRNAVWFYADPLPAVAAIADRVAFYPERVDRMDFDPDAE